MYISGPLYKYYCDLSGGVLRKKMYVLQGFHQVWYQGIVKATVFGVFEDFKLNISEGSDQN